MTKDQKAFASTDISKAVAQQLTKARTSLILDEPFFGHLALRLMLVESSHVTTLAVDAKHIYYNARYVAQQSPALTKSIIGHEVLHCVLEHIFRRGDRCRRRWNQAADYVVNAMLQDSGFEIGDSWLYNPDFADMTADQVYGLLPNCKTNPLDDCQIVDEDHTNVEATEWIIATFQAANDARKLGKLPSGLRRFVEDLTSQKVDWRHMLRQFFYQNLSDYHWLRPNNRFLSQGIYLPSLFSESMGDVVVAIDTSGSITQDALNTFGAEVKAIVQSVRPAQTTVIYCDDHVNGVDVFGPNDALKFTLRGGGCTDFRPPFAYIKTHNIQPACMVYLTDGYGPFGTEPDFPVLWCCTSEVIAPFGETISIRL